MRLSDAITEYEFATAATLSPHTAEWYSQKLRHFAQWAHQQRVTNLEDMNAPLIRRYLDWLRRTPSERTGKPITSHTLHGYFQVVKTFAFWCVREELLPDTFSKRLVPPRVEKKVIQTFSPSEIAALFKACEQEETPTLVWRDKTILAILLDGGLRASELVGLTLPQVHLTPQASWLLVKGKGAKEREVPLGQEARTLLHRYLTRFRRAAEDEEHIFLTRSGSQLTVEGLDRILYRLRDWAGITGVRCSAHTFRHTMAARFMLAGGDVFTLSHLLGHTHLSTTQVYLRDYQRRAARTAGLSVLDNLGRGA
jgi:site-specific recombinase XerD